MGGSLPPLLRFATVRAIRMYTSGDKTIYHTARCRIDEALRGFPVQRLWSAFINTNVVLLKGPHRRVHGPLNCFLPRQFAYVCQRFTLTLPNRLATHKHLVEALL